jgi:hypothetical protein
MFHLVLCNCEISDSYFVDKFLLCVHFTKFTEQIHNGRSCLISKSTYVASIKFGISGLQL